MNHHVDAQQKQTNFRSPIGIPLILSGNFGELRTNHFHTGLDIKTNGILIIEYMPLKMVLFLVLKFLIGDTERLFMWITQMD